MNEAPADPLLFAPPPPGRGVTRGKLLFLVALALAAHLAFLFVFSAKKPIIPRAVSRVPHLQLADNADELVALGDPTLFALPHANDFATAFWERIPHVAPPPFRWTEPPRWLPPNPEGFGADFRQFVQTNRLAESELNFKLPPRLSEVTVAFEPALPQKSTMGISGDLARRRQLNQVQPPALPLDAVIAPSRVQVLVDESGNVASVVLLESSTSDAADQLAMQLAAQLRFAPASRPTFGKITFHWHTVPTNTP